MKKLILLILAVISLSFLFSSLVYCVGESEFNEKMNGDLWNAVDNDTARALDYFEIDIFNPAGNFDFSLSSLAEYFKDDLTVKLKAILSFFLSACTLLVVSSSFSAIIKSESNSEMFEILLIILSVIISLSGMKNTINTLISMLNVGAKFMVAFIPVFASLVAFSGSVSAAFTYNTVVLGFAQGISAFVKNYGEKIIGSFFCLVISFSMNKEINLDRFVSMFSRFSTVAIGLFSTVFASLLSIKNILSVSIDSVGVRGIKFIVSSMIPVVGSAISEAYSSLLGSIGVIKGSVAAFGIIAIIIISFPALVEGVVLFCALSILSFLSEMLSLLKVASLLKGFCVGIKFLLLLAVFEAFIMIISTALLISFKG